MTKTQQNYLGCLLLLLFGIAVGPFVDEDNERENRLATFKANIEATTLPIRLSETRSMTGIELTDDGMLLLRYVEKAKSAARFSEDDKEALRRQAVADVCENRETIENFTFLKAYRYEWRDAEDQAIVEVTVTPETCLRR